VDKAPTAAGPVLGSSVCWRRRHAARRTGCSIGTARRSRPHGVSQQPASRGTIRSLASGTCPLGTWSARDMLSASASTLRPGLGDLPWIAHARGWQSGLRLRSGWEDLRRQQNPRKESGPHHFDRRSPPGRGCRFACFAAWEVVSVWFDLELSSPSPLTSKRQDPEGYCDVQQHPTRLPLGNQPPNPRSRVV
jgi:hypothetical protein